MNTSFGATRLTYVNFQSECEEFEASDEGEQEIRAENETEKLDITETDQMQTGTSKEKGQLARGNLVSAAKGLMHGGLAETGGERSQVQTGKGKGRGVRNGPCSNKEVTAVECADMRETPLGRGKEKGFLDNLTLSKTATVSAGTGSGREIQDGQHSAKGMLASGFFDTREVQTSGGRGYLESIVSIEEVITSVFTAGKEWHPHHSVCIPAYGNHSWVARRKRDQLAQLES